MNAAIRNLALAGAALAALGVAGCASARLSEQAAAMPVFKSEQTHPAVTRVVGPVTAYVCLWSKNEASIVDDALNSLRGSADAKGANALVDYRYAFITNTPRQQVCQHQVRADAEAVVMQGGA
jgi:uncharacterized protein YbjQ (UPF0145 family)